MPFERPGGAPRATPFQRLGGRDAVDRIVEEFYRRLADDPELRPLFPQDLGPGIKRQQDFLEQWLGGPPTYSRTHGNPMLRRRHFPFVIGTTHAERWLMHMRAALEACNAPTDVAAEVMQRLEPLAQHMVNEGHDVPREPLRRDGEP